jgi:NADH:ubiquinone oxidoreductase subunit E
MEYTLEVAVCLGVCALEPNLVAIKETHSKMNPKRVSQLLGDRRERG